MKSFLALTSVIVMAASTMATAGDHGCCDGCGCHCNVKKVCRLICEEKEVKEVEWDCECEDFCLPGKSEICCEKCKCNPCKPHCPDCEKVWNPSRCAEVRTRKILIKNEVKKKVPSYKWVVETVCCECGYCRDGACATDCDEAAEEPAPASADEAPAPPQAANKKASTSLLADFRAYFAE